MNTRDPGKPGASEAHDHKAGDDEAQELESRINALLDGELDPAAEEALKAAAREDDRLAQAIVAAWQLRDGLDHLAIEKAPARLRRRLQRIPLEQGETPVRSAFGSAGWALAVGVVAVAAVALALVMDPQVGEAPDAGPRVAGNESQDNSTQPDFHPGVEPADVAAARRDLAIAFSYLDKAGLRTSREIRAVLKEELASPIKDNLSRHIPYMAQATKEKHA